MCRGIKKTLEKLNICLNVKRKKVCLFSHKNYIFFINFDVRKMKGGERRMCFLRKKNYFLNFKSVGGREWLKKTVWERS